jgi:hypothetical protein
LLLGNVSLAVFGVSLVLTIIFAITKKIKLMNRFSLVMIGSLIIFSVAVFSEPEEVINQSPELSKMRQIDQNIESVSFNTVYMKGDTIYAEIVWSGKASEEPKEYGEAFSWLENIEQMLNNQYKTLRPTNQINLLFYSDDEEIAALKVRSVK